MKDSKRKVYVVSFLELVESTNTPKIELIATKKSHKWRRLYPDAGYIKIETSKNKSGSLSPVDLRTFKNKDEFISHMVQKAVSAWDHYESEKTFDKECGNILQDIYDGEEPKVKNEWLLEDEDEWIKDFYKQEPLDSNASEEDIIERVKDIKGRNVGGWEPYLIMREVYGLDFIREPDIANDENLKEIRSKRPDPMNNNGIVRRSQ